MDRVASAEPGASREQAGAPLDEAVDLARRTCPARFGTGTDPSGGRTRPPMRHGPDEPRRREGG